VFYGKCFVFVITLLYSIFYSAGARNKLAFFFIDLKPTSAAHMPPVRKKLNARSSLKVVSCLNYLIAKQLYFDYAKGFYVKSVLIFCFSDAMNVNPFLFNRTLFAFFYSL
jgi:hypothetical protein